MPDQNIGSEIGNLSDLADAFKSAPRTASGHVDTNSPEGIKLRDAGVIDPDGNLTEKFSGNEQFSGGYSGGMGAEGMSA